MLIFLSGFLLFCLFQNVFTLTAKDCSNSKNELPSVTFPPNPQMHFYLFTNKNFDKEQEIFTGNSSSLINSNFNKDWPVRILVHGWSYFGLSCGNALLKDAYLQNGDFNVIIVDWWDWSKNQLYLPIVPLIFDGIIGKSLSDFTVFLNSPFDNMYCIGHSMGAHICGAAGEFNKPNNNIFNTIFGLDPAGPSYQGNEPNKRLDKSQANYVEQISTNQGLAGYSGRIGHAAFYPNYGSYQKLCLKIDIASLLVSCSHNAGYYYFGESINTKTGFCAAPLPNSKPQCDPKILMGGEPSIKKDGDFTLVTNENQPYASCNC